MVDASAELDGYGPQAIWVQHRRVGQDAAGNFSQFYVELRYYGNGYGSWTNNPIYWSISVSGWYVEGSFTIPIERRYEQYTVIWSGYYNRAHAADGTLGAFGGVASMNGSTHAAIGSGSVGFTEPASPRIAKRPSPPPFSIDQVTAESFRVVVQASADNGGSPVSQYLIRVSDRAQADTPGSYEDFPGSGTATIGNRDPGKTYYVTVYAKNGSVDNNGYSNYQTSKPVTTLAGVYVSDGTKWVAAGMRVSTGSAWEDVVPEVSTGSVWEEPS
ncbi:minor tail protein [Microbacterium phage Milani]|nr:minor tail protein [Microbacterium phage Milani]